MTNEERLLNCKISLALLMPEAQVKRLCGEITGFKKIRYVLASQYVDAVVKKFNVSRDVATARLIGLKLIGGVY